MASALQSAILRLARELVTGQILDLLDELGTAMEAWCDVGVARPLVTPTEDTPFHRAQPRRRWTALSTAGELAHLDHAVNEFWAAAEALRDVGDGYFLLDEALDSTFDRTKTLDVNHDLAPTCVTEASPFWRNRQSWLSEVALAYHCPRLGTSRIGRL